MKKYYFVFCKDELMLERLPDGTYTIPYQTTPPTEIKPWTTVMNITPLGETEVKRCAVCEPVSIGYPMSYTSRLENVSSCSTGIRTPDSVGYVEVR